MKSSLSPAYGMEEFVPNYDMAMNWGEHCTVRNNRYSMDRRIDQVRKALS